MAYYLKRTKKQNDVYFQIYESFYEKKTKKVVSKSVKAIGLSSKLFKSGINDPEKYCIDLVKEMNEKRKNKIEKGKEKKIGDNPIKYFGHFIIQKLINKLNYKTHLNYMNYNQNFLPFDLTDFINDMVFSRIIFPTSKLKTYEEVLPSLINRKYDSNLDNIYKGIEFIGQNYQRVIECLNYHIDKKYPSKTDKTYFDCTNFYFQINQEDDFRKKGPSKERRVNPIVLMSLLLDADMIPLNMKIFPGNQSEKPMLRKTIKDMKNSMNISGKTIQIADKGLNTAKNIIESIESGDGYIFGKSIKKMSSEDRNELLKDLDFDILKSDKLGEIDIAYTSKIVETEYSYKDENNKIIKKIIKEKRVITWNSSLASKNGKETLKLADKAINMNKYQYKKDFFGQASKYIKSSVKNDVEFEVDYDKIEEDLKICGFNLLVTSETEMDDLQIINSYSNLWRIEESFKILKSELDARPIYLQKEDSIVGHFLICYISVLFARLLEFKFFENKYNANTIFRVIRGLKCTKIQDEDKYINLSSRTKELEEIADELSVNLLNYYFSPNELKKFFK